jgi:hypothetical protein
MNPLVSERSLGCNPAHRVDSQEFPDFTRSYALTAPCNGLVNQLFTIVACLIRARWYGKNIVIVDSFLQDIEKGNICPISNILDLPTTNLHLRQIPYYSDMELVDRQDTTHYLEVVRAEFGLRGTRTIDVTESVRALQRRGARVSHYVDLWGDPPTRTP